VTARHIHTIMTQGYARFETQHRRKDGQLLDIEVSVIHRPYMGDEYFFVFLRDITEHKLTEAKLAEQVDDLRRWHDATIGREMRVLDLKHEVNELLGQTGQPPRYPSAESDDPQEK